MIRFQFDMTVLTSIGDTAFPYSSEFMVLIAGKKRKTCVQFSICVLGIDSEDYVLNFI